MKPNTKTPIVIQLEKVEDKRSLLLHFIPWRTEGLFFLAKGGEAESPQSPSPVFTHQETRPPRATYAYAPSGSGPRDVYLSRKHSQRSLQDEMDLGGNPLSHRRGSPFVAIGN
jgi:hypothetical protein